MLTDTNWISMMFEIIKPNTIPIIHANVWCVESPNAMNL